MNTKQSENNAHRTDCVALTISALGVESREMRVLARAAAQDVRHQKATGRKGSW